MRERVVPWQDLSRMDNRGEFVRLAGAEGANVAQLCRRFGISRKTGYKWLGRHALSMDCADVEQPPDRIPTP